MQGGKRGGHPVSFLKLPDYPVFAAVRPDPPGNCVQRGAQDKSPFLPWHRPEKGPPVRPFPVGAFQGQTIPLSDIFEYPRWNKGAYFYRCRSFNNGAYYGGRRGPYVLQRGLHIFPFLLIHTDLQISPSILYVAP